MRFTNRGKPMNRIELEIERDWTQEQYRLEHATPRQAFEIAWVAGRISGGAEVGSAMVAAIERAEKAKGDTQ